MQRILNNPPIVIGLAFLVGYQVGKRYNIQLLVKKETF
jgi:ascorbate-specific PTS system EIIC-type component UlaA